jgi:hypothetical protein
MTKTIIKSLLSILLVLLLTTKSALAFPGGAGGCAGGMAAVAGPHLSSSKTIETGSLKDGGVKVSVNGKFISPGKTSKLRVGKTNKIKVSGKKIKGVLIRTESSSTYTLDPDGTLVQPSMACSSLGDADIEGVTHNSAVEKSSASALLFTNSSASFALDVTVVMENSATTSEYYYSGFTLLGKTGSKM